MIHPGIPIFNKMPVQEKVPQIHQADLLAIPVNIDLIHPGPFLDDLNGSELIGIQPIPLGRFRGVDPIQVNFDPLMVSQGGEGVAVGHMDDPAGPGKGGEEEKGYDE